MKKFSVMLIVAVAVLCQSCSLFDRYTVKREELPAEAREMLDEYFPKALIGMIKVDKHLLKKTDYDVRLVNGTTIEFSNKGKWTSVDCKSKAVPDGLVIRPIRNYVSKNFSGVKITSVRKKATGYEVGLSDGVGLKFNLLGSYTGVTDISGN